MGFSELRARSNKCDGILNDSSMNSYGQVYILLKASHGASSNRVYREHSPRVRVHSSDAPRNTCQGTICHRALRPETKGRVS